MEKIKHHSVVSSNIQSAGYDETSRSLEITFSNGSTYRYDEIPRYIYEGIFKSDSPGGFVQKWIVRGKYKNKKLGAKPKK